jgi:hypothetical protein
LVPLLFVAVTVQEAVVEGAVKSPDVLIEPHDAAHVAAADAVNCCVAPTFTVALVGDIVKAADVTVTWAVALVPLLFVAVTVQEPVVEGAVNSPDVLIEPHDAAHVAAADAVNCCVAPTFTEALVGEIEKVEAEVIVAVVEAFWPPLVAVAVMVQEPVVAGAV